MVPRDEVLEILFGLLPRFVRAFPHLSHIIAFCLLTKMSFLRLIKEHDLPADRPYVFGYHPHGKFKACVLGHLVNMLSDQE